MSDHKKRIVASVEKWSKSQLPSDKPVRKKTNDDPEAQFVRELLPILRSLNWSVDVIESKAAFNVQAGRYLEGRAAAGYSDISGCMSDGLAIYLETKAPKKRNTLRPDQHQFLTTKINSNAFAIVTDSIVHFQNILEAWKNQPDAESKRNLLLGDLPDLAPRYKKDLEKSIDDWFEGD